MLPENWQAMQLLEKLSTQWHTTALNTMQGAKVIYQGLRYDALSMLIDLYYPDQDKAKLFSNVQMAEQLARHLLNGNDLN